MFNKTRYNMIQRRMRIALTALLVTALLHSTGHTFAHFAAGSDEKPAVLPTVLTDTTLAPVQHDEPITPTAGNASHSCVGCESLQKLRDVLPTGFALTLTCIALTHEWQRHDHVTTPAFASHASRAPPQA